jgi:hypothetical protein
MIYRMPVAHKVSQSQLHGNPSTSRKQIKRLALRFWQHGKALRAVHKQMALVVLNAIAA